MFINNNILCALTVQKYRHIIAIHPDPEPKCMDAFLHPFVADLARFGPPRRNQHETNAEYLNRVESRPNKLIIREVKYKKNLDGSVNKEDRPDVSTRDDIIVFVGPFCADTPMRRKLSKRGATASKLACMCCLLYVIPP